MTKFLEVKIGTDIYAINVDNISMIKQIDASITEIRLFSKNPNGSYVKLRIAYNYGNFRHFLTTEDAFVFPAAMIANLQPPDEIP